MPSLMDEINSAIINSNSENKPDEAISTVPDMPTTTSPTSPKKPTWLRKKMDEFHKIMEQHDPSNRSIYWKQFMDPRRVMLAMLPTIYELKKMKMFEGRKQPSQ